MKAEEKEMIMTVGELKKRLADIPDNVRIIFDCGEEVGIDGYVGHNDVVYRDIDSLYKISVDSEFVIFTTCESFGALCIADRKNLKEYPYYEGDCYGGEWK